MSCVRKKNIIICRHFRYFGLIHNSIIQLAAARRRTVTVWIRKHWMFHKIFVIFLYFYTPGKLYVYVCLSVIEEVNVRVCGWNTGTLWTLQFSTKVNSILVSFTDLTELVRAEVYMSKCCEHLRYYPDVVPKAGTNKSEFCENLKIFVATDILWIFVRPYSWKLLLASFYRVWKESFNWCDRDQCIRTDRSWELETFSRKIWSFWTLTDKTHWFVFTLLEGIDCTSIDR